MIINIIIETDLYNNNHTAIIMTENWYKGNVNWKQNVTKTYYHQYNNNKYNYRNIMCVCIIIVTANITIETKW